MTKFKVGDSFKYISDIDKGFFTKNQNYEVLKVRGESVSLKDNYGQSHRISFNYLKEHFKFNNSKPTKNQRITTLEETVAKQSEEISELKLIVHELRERPQLTTVINNAPQGPSTTNPVEDIIEFEGKQYRKVDRVAHEGDVVIITNEAEETCEIQKNKPYKVDEHNQIAGSTHPYRYKVYKDQYNRTPETVDVYELIDSKPLTPNQQRFFTIENAKRFVAERQVALLFGYVDFIINSEKRTVVALIKPSGLKQVVERGIAKCAPDDVFNEHIGKAISLGRALGLDVSEFEQAVQPTKAVLGMTVYYKNEKCGQFIATIEKEREVQTANIDLEQGDGFWKVTIINDTNAIYEVKS